MILVIKCRAHHSRLDSFVAIYWFLGTESKKHPYTFYHSIDGVFHADAEKHIEP